LRAREYTKRIKIYKDVTTSDNFGGNINSDTPTLVLDTWANIKTLKSASVSVDLGLISTENNIIIKIRNRANTEIKPNAMWLTYRGDKYSIKTTPTNLDFKDNIVMFICTKI